MSFTLYNPLTGNVLSGEEMQKVVDLCINPDFFALKSNADVAMVQTIAAVDTYQDVVFNNVDATTNGDIDYTGGIVTYNGSEPVEMTMNLACSLESSSNNTLIHIGQAQKGTVDAGAESSSECSNLAELQSFNIATKFILQPGDTLNLKIKADKTATISIYHFQVVLKQNKIKGV